MTGGNAKNSNVTAKDKSNLKSAVPVSRNQRAVLSQSLSFPARRAHGDGLMKSIDGYKEKTDRKRAQQKGKKVQAPLNGSVASLSRLSHPNRRRSINLDSKPETMNGGGVTARRTTLASFPSNRQAVVWICDLSFRVFNFFFLYGFLSTSLSFYVCLWLSACKIWF